ncbi:MAG: polyprenol monophosphomannose synthase [Solirubrobacteraceae bacterium]
MSARIWVVIPTYNEAENIEPIVDAVSTEMAAITGSDYRILIVDDNSTDGTRKLANQLAATNEHVEILNRPDKQGLGRAYIAGFQQALANGAEMVIQMDADFSHHPGYLKDLVAAAQEADLVLGSRYVRGGAVQNWGLMRRLISRGGSTYARTVLRVPVRDLTGGFKCIHSSVLETINLNSLRADGYVFQIELTYRALQAGFKVREVPIVFADRTAGQSKMSFMIALEALALVLRLRRTKARQLARS